VTKRGHSFVKGRRGEEVEALSSRLCCVRLDWIACMAWRALRASKPAFGPGCGHAFEMRRVYWGEQSMYDCADTTRNRHIKDACINATRSPGTRVAGLQRSSYINGSSAVST
jgi:hypothetical protein